MRLRDWFMPPEGGGPEPAPAEAGNLNEIRASADSLLSAGDDAINRALSGNSEAFLAATRQQGGE